MNEQSSQQQSFRILVVNPGSTSTKMAIFDDEAELVEQTIRHDADELLALGNFLDTQDLRQEGIVAALEGARVAPESLDAVVGRGGLTKPIASGTYEVNDAMVADLRSGEYGLHGCNLGGLIAQDLGRAWNIPAYVVDPVVVDELEPVARVTGVPGIEHRCSWHALNQKAICRRYAAERGRTYDELNLVVAHMGGGITVGAHRHGRTVDVSNAIEGEGPMSPERSGAVPYLPLMQRVERGESTFDELAGLPSRTGGIKAYLGTSDMREVEARVVAGDDEAALLFDACAYQIAKAIGAACAVLEGEVDAILLTGGLAYSERFCEAVAHRVRRLAPELAVYPGEDELLALAQGGLRVLRGEEEAKVYA